MATWTVSRNNYIPVSNGVTGRSMFVFCLLKDMLQGATLWSCLGSGTGSISVGATSVFDKSAPTTTPGAGKDLLPTYADLRSGAKEVVTDINTDAWICLRNQDGVEIVLQYGGSGYAHDFYVSQSGSSGGYTNGMSHSATARIGGVGGPADEETILGNDYDKSPAGDADNYKHVAVSDDGNSFYLFGRYDADGNYLMAFVKLENVDPADVTPTYLPYWFMNAGSSGDNGCGRGYGANTNHSRGIHPVAGVMGYSPIEHYGNNYWWTEMQPSPDTNKYQKMELLLGRSGGANGHIRGKIPQLYRVSGTRGDGTISDDGLVILGDYMFPWGSTTEVFL